MKVTLVIDRERREVEVDLAKGTARYGASEYPVRVLSSSATSVELEIAGERVKVDDWPVDVRSPTASVTVDGERYQVSAEVSGTAGAPPTSVDGGAALPPSPMVPEAPGSTAILPPMPGKVIEVRVSEGERVQRGAVLLVLEAMKMRNEVTTPRDGVVRGLRVSPGSSVKAREPMLSIADD